MAGRLSGPSAQTEARGSRLNLVNIFAVRFFSFSLSKLILYTLCANVRLYENIIVINSNAKCCKRIRIHAKYGIHEDSENPDFGL